MKSLFGYFLLWLVSTLLFLLLTLPVSRLVPLLQQQYPKLYIHNPEGVIWEGTIDQLSIPQWIIPKLSWSLSPLSILRGRPVIEWMVGNEKTMRGSGVFSTTLSTTPLLEFSNTQFTIPLEMIKQLSPLQVEVSGVVSGSIDRLITTRYGEIKSAERGTVTLSSLSVGSGAEQIHLGNFSGTIKQQNSSVLLTIQSLKALAGVAGTIQYNGKLITGKITIKPSPDSPPNLHQVLRHVSTLDQQDSYQLKFEISLVK